MYALAFALVSCVACTLRSHQTSSLQESRAALAVLLQALAHLPLSPHGPLLQLALCGPLSSKLLQLLGSSSTPKSNLYALQLFEAGTAALLLAAVQLLHVQGAVLWLLAGGLVALQWCLQSALTQTTLRRAGLPGVACRPLPGVSDARQHAPHFQIGRGAKAARAAKSKAAAAAAVAPASIQQAQHAAASKAESGEESWQATWIVRMLQVSKAAHMAGCCVAAASTSAGSASHASLSGIGMALWQLSSSALLQMVPQLVLLSCIWELESALAAAKQAAGVFSTSLKPSTGLLSSKPIAELTGPVGTTSKPANNGGVCVRASFEAIRAVLCPWASNSSSASSGGVKDAAASSNQLEPAENSETVATASPGGGAAHSIRRDSAGDAAVSIDDSVPAAAAAPAAASGAAAAGDGPAGAAARAVAPCAADSSGAAGHAPCQRPNSDQVAGAVSELTAVAASVQAGTSMLWTLEEQQQATTREPARELTTQVAAWRAWAQGVLGQAHVLVQDLANPVNGVLALSQALVEAKHGELSPSMQAQVGLVRACAHQGLNMLSMYADVLSCARAAACPAPCETSGNTNSSAAALSQQLGMQLVALTVAPQVEKAFQRLAPMAGARLQLHHQVDCSRRVWADEKRLYQGLHVVVANAVKYARQGRVEVRCAASADGSQLVISVQDTGPGFTVEQLETYNRLATALGNSHPMPGARSHDMAPSASAGLGLTAQLQEHMQRRSGAVAAMPSETGAVSEPTGSKLPSASPHDPCKLGLGLRAVALLLHGMGGKLLVSNNSRPVGDKTSGTGGGSTGACVQLVLRALQDGGADFVGRPSLSGAAAHAARRRGQGSLFGAEDLPLRASLNGGFSRSSGALGSSAPHTQVPSVAANAPTAAALVVSGTPGSSGNRRVAPAAVAPASGTAAAAGVASASAAGTAAAGAASGGSSTAGAAAAAAAGQPPASRTPGQQQKQQRKRRLLSSVPAGARTAPRAEKPQDGQAPVISADGHDATPAFLKADAPDPGNRSGPAKVCSAGSGLGRTSSSGHQAGTQLASGATAGPVVLQAPRCESGGGVRAGRRGCTILLVEDDPSNAALMEEMLTGAGYDCITAGDGSSALMSFMSADSPAHVVLLDASLPDMRGLDVCQKLISLSPGVPPPIIMLSSACSTSEVVEGLQAGASDWVVKPFKPQELLARIESHLRLHDVVHHMEDTAERNVQLLSQVLPPHVMGALQGGSRVLVEKFPDVCVLHAEVIGTSSLMSSANSMDCVSTLNTMVSIFDPLADKHAVHKVESVGFMYCLAVGHQPDDHQGRTATGQLAALLQCGKDMLQVVHDMPYPETLGKMELRIGLHAGPLAAGILGVKYPRYCFFGSTQRLSMALAQAAPPMSLHVSEMVFNRVKGTLGCEADYAPFTLSSFQGLGIIRTYLVATEWLDMHALSNVNLPDYLAKISSSEADSLQVMQSLVSTSNEANSSLRADGTTKATTAATHGAGLHTAPSTNAAASAAFLAAAGMGTSAAGPCILTAQTQRYEAMMNAQGKEARLAAGTAFMPASATGGASMSSAFTSLGAPSTTTTTNTTIGGLAAASSGRPAFGETFKAVMAAVAAGGPGSLASSVLTNPSTGASQSAQERGESGPGFLTGMRSGSPSQTGSLTGGRTTPLHISRNTSNHDLQGLLARAGTSDLSSGGHREASPVTLGAAAALTHRGLAGSTSGSGIARSPTHPNMPRSGGSTSCGGAEAQGGDCGADVAAARGSHGDMGHPHTMLAGHLSTASWGDDPDPALLQELGLGSHLFSHNSVQHDPHRSPHLHGVKPHGGGHELHGTGLHGVGHEPADVPVSFQVPPAGMLGTSAGSGSSSTGAMAKLQAAMAQASASMQAQAEQQQRRRQVQRTLSIASLKSNASAVSIGSGVAHAAGRAEHGHNYGPAMLASAMASNGRASVASANGSANGPANAPPSPVARAGMLHPAVLTLGTRASAVSNSWNGVVMGTGAGKESPTTASGSVGSGPAQAAGGFQMSAAAMARARHAMAGLAAKPSADNDAAPAAGAAAAVPVAAAAAAAGQQPQAYGSVGDLMDALGTAYYTKALMDKGLGVADLAALDDDGLRKAGLVTARARKQVIAELTRIGMRAAA